MKISRKKQKEEKLIKSFSIFNDVEIFKIVLTGGPCAGKTTAITTIAERLWENGFIVFIVPEAASMIFRSGGDLNL